MFDLEKTYTLPFKYSIPILASVFLKQNSIIWRWLKYKKRQIFINIKHQNSLELDRILPSQNHILWINISAPSLGDSLMDLSSRVMLKGREVDLFTDKKNAELYRSDKIFRNIFTHKNEVNASLYDLTIIDSYSSRSINFKADIAPLTPFVGMYGYFNGPEVNRVLFSFHRLNQLLGYINTNDEINAKARTLISISNSDQSIIQQKKLPRSYIAIVIGGEWEHRTYKKWEEVIRLLFMQEDNLNIVIVGSANAKKTAKELSVNFQCNNFINCVAKFSFTQTAQIINQAILLLCCDGGLMHVANAVNTPVVPLLSRLSAKMQLTELIKDFSLFDNDDVNNITEKHILEKYIEAATYVDNHPRVE